MKGYRHHITEEAILKYMQWPVEVRLAWLEEANRFLDQALPEDSKKIRQGLRLGFL
ncbi:MAG TPA: hypothetical protein VML36_10060 [Nitrospiria bacterium]|nr:hypothetical protein [Nitrospiria bacterium]